MALACKLVLLTLFYSSEAACPSGAAAACAADQSTASPALVQKKKTASRRVTSEATEAGSSLTELKPSDREDHNNQDKDKDETQEETKTIHVLFNSFADTNKTAELIMDAMKEAGLTLEEWKPLTERNIPDHNSTFPVTMDVDFERRPSVSVAAATNLAPVQALLQEEDEQDEDLSFNQTLVDLILDGKSGKKPTRKQKNWAARAISELESSVCSRHRERKYAAYWRRSYLKGPWQSCASGWDNIWGFCHLQCESGYYASGPMCHVSCGKAEDTWSECIERCSEVPGDPSPLDTTCSLFYCGQSTQDCVHHGAKIALSFAEMFANFVPGGKALTSIKYAVKQGTMVAMKAAMKKAVREIAKKMLTKARKNLYKEMKSARRDLKDELKDAILQGGAEQVAEVFIAKTSTDYLKEVAIELVKAVDPTGIADVVGAFEADRCRDKIIPRFPDDNDCYCNGWCKSKNGWSRCSTCNDIGGQYGSSGWCYTANGACDDGKPSEGYPAYDWSSEACTDCSCNGWCYEGNTWSRCSSCQDIGGQYGSSGWCFTAKGACSDGRSSGVYAAYEWSIAACSR